MSGLVTRQIRGGGGVAAERISVSFTADPATGSVALVFDILGCQAVSQGLVAVPDKYFLHL